MSDDIRIVTVSASSQVSEADRGQVIVSGSYGGEYNAFHAAKWGIRGVVLCDAGIGKDDAGIRGLSYLDGVGVPAACADVWTCHIADGEHMLAHGVISFVNKAARALGCAKGMTVRACAEAMKAGPPQAVELPPIAGGKRYTIRDVPGEPKVICLDAAPMLTLEDAGAIAVTGSHAALFHGRPDGLIAPAVAAVFFSDGGVGLDAAGIRRLRLLDERNIPAGTAAAASAPIGDSRRIYQEGVLSYVNRSAEELGAATGIPVSVFITMLLERARGGTS
ncbi:hypothetical protein [Elioraea sp.]|uniref:hypothetical protein n=1 Tax=Elioraea sp. TaxID=2185103 RepID=UPI0025C6F367|nr:hypothetical protein [Elioraea sp.]